MPSFPPEGRGPDGVPIGQALPSKPPRKKKQTDTPAYPAYIGQPPGAM
jgi:hypothetical protein